MAKQVEIKNLSITCHENFDESMVENVLQNACESVNLEHDHINLIKVSIGAMRMEQARTVLHDIMKAFKDKGVDNCIFVPVCESGIQDITMERIEIHHERV